MKRPAVWPRPACVMTVVLALTVLAGTSAQAERFQMIELDENGEQAFLRVDLETGAVSRCLQNDNIWQCAAIDERSSEATAVLEKRIADLEARVAMLEEQRRDRPDVTELEDALDLSEQFMRRFFGMVQDMKKDMAD
jgi:uncharacterized coiled-coil protein SlyX